MKNEKVRFRTIELDKEDTEILIEGMTAEMKFIDDIEMENRHLTSIAEKSPFVRWGMRGDIFI